MSFCLAPCRDADGGLHGRGPVRHQGRWSARYGGASVLCGARRRVCCSLSRAWGDAQGQSW